MAYQILKITALNLKCRILSKIVQVNHLISIHLRTSQAIIAAKCVCTLATALVCVVLSNSTIVTVFNCHCGITWCTLHMWVPSVCRMVDKECHYTSLQQDRKELLLCLLYCQVLTVEIGPHTQTLYDDDHIAQWWGIRSTLGSRMMGRKVVQESSQQFLVLEHSTQHMGHCGCEKSEVDYYQSL